MSENEEIDFEFEDESFDGEKGKPLLTKLFAKCTEFSIGCERDDEEYGQFVRIEIKKGRGKKVIFLGSLETVSVFVESKFERFVFLEEVEAIWNPSEKYIEAALQAVPSTTNRTLMSMFNAEDFGDLPQKLDDGINIKSDKADYPKIQFISPSNEFIALIRSGHRRARNEIMLRLIDVEAENGPHALRILQKIANSIFFQLDMTTESSFELARVQGIRDRILPRKQEYIELNFPNQEYEYAPISLYWYARSANRLPLLQYLAYYQTIEYFFGHYAAENARQRIKVLLKNPTFRVDRDTDISKIVELAGNSRNGIGSEKEQLLTTINSCLSADEIREFLNLESIVEFLTSDAGKKFHAIPVRGKNIDLRSDLAARIYDIRCRIVHTKAEGGNERVDLLLPFSKEAGSLGFDVEIIKFVSRQVLIHSSSDFRI